MDEFWDIGAKRISVGAFRRVASVVVGFRVARSAVAHFDEHLDDVGDGGVGVVIYAGGGFECAIGDLFGDKGGFFEGLVSFVGRHANFFLDAAFDVFLPGGEAIDGGFGFFGADGGGDLGENSLELASVGFGHAAT